MCLVSSVYLWAFCGQEPGKDESQALLFFQEQILLLNEILHGRPPSIHWISEELAMAEWETWSTETSTQHASQPPKMSLWTWGPLECTMKTTVLGQLLGGQEGPLCPILLGEANECEKSIGLHMGSGEWLLLVLFRSG